MSTTYLNNTEAYKRRADEQGRSPVKDDAGRLLFPSGTRCDSAGYSATNPPDDPRERVKRRKVNCRIRRDRVGKDLRQLEAATKGYADAFRWPEKEYGPGPATPDDALTLLRRVLAEREQALVELDAEVAATPARGGP